MALPLKLNKIFFNYLLQQILYKLHVLTVHSRCTTSSTRMDTLSMAYGQP